MSYVDELAAHAWYLNNLPRAEEHFEPDQLEQFKQDMAKAEAAMQRAYLELIPTEGNIMDPDITPAVTLTPVQAQALALYIREHGFDYAQAATIGVILELCEKAHHE